MKTPFFRPGCRRAAAGSRSDRGSAVRVGERFSDCSPQGSCQAPMVAGTPKREPAGMSSRSALYAMSL